MQAPPFGVQFNLVGLFDVLEHLPNDQQVLDNLYSMLLPGGALLLTVPAFPSLWSYFDEASHHVERYQAGELQAKLEKAGFKVETISYYMMSIFPLVWMQRKLAPGRSTGRLQDEQEAHDRAEGDLKIVPVANQVLNEILGLEARWLSHGHRLPFGTSLLALGRKTA
jgi:SAM-dependent methyltransferase